MENGAKNTKTPCVKNTLVRGYRDLKLRKTRGVKMALFRLNLTNFDEI